MGWLVHGVVPFQKIGDRVMNVTWGWSLLGFWCGFGGYQKSVETSF